MTLPTNEPKDVEAELKKPPVNEIARIVNTRFLQSPYEGKDWESVRKDLITELTEVQARTRQAAIEAITADMVTPDRVNPQPLEPYARGFNSGLSHAVALLTRLEKEGKDNG